MKKRLLSIAVAALSAATAMAQPMMVYEPSVTQGTYTPLESPTLISLGATALM